MTTKKKRTVGLLSIVIIYRGSESVQSHAAQLVADYEA